MLQFLIPVAAFLLLLYYLESRNKLGREDANPIPGLKPSNPSDGNNGDIQEAGSLHEFLVDLHAKKGDIVSFWMGNEMTVSIASPRLFKASSKLFNRPVEFYRIMDSLCTSNTLAICNGDEGRRRLAMAEPAFSHQAMANYYETLQHTMEELVERLDSVPVGEHLGLMESLRNITFKVITRSLLGSSFTDENIGIFLKYYQKCIVEVERQMAGDIPGEGSQRIQEFNKHRREMVVPIIETIQSRRENPARPGEECLVDILVSNGAEDGELCADVVIFTVAGFHTSVPLYTWLIYHIMTNPEVECKLLEEISMIIGKGDLTPSNIGDLTYTRQVIEEVLRISTLGTFIARVTDEDMELGGYMIPAKTTIFQAIGAVLLDPKLWPDPHKFDPERFSPKNISKQPSFSFEPFGFAGKRKCAGYRLAYLGATMLLTEILPKFHFKVVEGQDISTDYGFVSKPHKEIWVEIERRD